MLDSGLLSSFRNTELGKQLNSQELEMMLEHNNTVFFETGEIILQQGKKSGGIYIIMDGSAVVAAKILGEKTVNLGTLKPGNFFGEASFIENTISTTSITANTKMVCLFFTTIYFEWIFFHFPETRYKILHAIALQIFDRLKKIHDKIGEFIAHSEIATRSFFRDLIQSLTQPEEINPREFEFFMEDFQKWPLFNAFTPEEVMEVFKHGVFLKAGKNCTLIHAERNQVYCYLVIQGGVQSSIVQNNKLTKLSVIGPATLFASTTCIDADVEGSAPLTVTFSTCEKALLFRIGKEDLDFFKKNHPAVWYKLFYLICKSMVALEKSIDKLDSRLHIEIYNR